MSAMPSPTQSEFSADSLPSKASVEGLTVRPADLKYDHFPNGPPSLGKRAALSRFLITFCIGAAATVAWQSYGNAARELIASKYPQLGWLAPQAAPVVQSAPEMIVTATPAAPSPDQQQINAMSLSLDALRQSVDRIDASQEQVTRSVDQLAAGQEQMSREITKLQAVEQYVLYKNSEPPPRPAPAPSRNSVPRPSQVPIQLTPARNP
jgi:hypothetical protein